MTLFGPLSMQLRTFRILCASLGLACLVLVGSGIYLASEWNKSTSVGVQEVLADFRSSEPPTDATTPQATTAPDPSTAVTEAPAGGGAEAPATGAPAALAGATTVPTTTPPPPGTAPFTRPAEGVYTYRAAGGETLSIGGASHSYPAEVFAIVRHTACGYRLEMPVLQEHHDTTEVCLDGGRLLLQSFTQRLTFFGQSDAGGFSCAPPAVLVDRTAGPGSSHPTSCTSAPLQGTGTATFVGTESVSIDGGAVDGSVVEWRWTASGKATGTGVARWVFDDTGLPLRIERDNATESASVLGPATHAESASFVLESRSPQR